MFSKNGIERPIMKKLKQKILHMEGTKKRVGDIKNIFQAIETNMQLLHNSLISTNNCITFLYSWGHIIIYTFPQDRIITIDFLYPLWYKDMDAIIKAILSIFQPETYDIKDITR